MCKVWCSGIQGIYAQLEGGQSAIGICAFFYIYRSTMTCAKFGVAVLQASMLNWGGQAAMGICALCYI